MGNIDLPGSLHEDGNVNDTCAILAIVTIYHRETDTRRCLDAFATTDANGIALTVALAVNGASPPFLAYLRRVYDGLEPGIPQGASTRFYQFANPGKGVAVNDVVRQEKAAGGRFDFVLSFDADLVAQKPSWLHDLLQGYRQSLARCRTGGVVSDQCGNCCHVPRKAQQVSAPGTDLVYAENNEGIAGGCLLVPFDVWEQVGGYKAHRVYGSDDAHFMEAAWLVGYSVCIVKACTMFHPYSDDAGYQDWKVRACQDRLRDDEKGGYYGTVGVRC